MTSVQQSRFDRDTRILPNGCMVLVSSVKPGGYSNFYWGPIRGTISGHRAAWKLAGRTLADEHILDHLCRNRWCVNADHLEEVTPSENNLRGELTKNTDTCAKGLHPWREEFWFITSDGYPTCRPCRDEWRRQYRLRTGR